jgi:F0F1-type ATP synthase delta subunit
VEKLANGADVSFSVKPELIAGARIRLDDRVIDNTLSGRAARLKQTLLETT